MIVKNDYKTIILDKNDYRTTQGPAVIVDKSFFNP